MPPCVTSLWVKVRSETAQRGFKKPKKQTTQLHGRGFPCMCPGLPPERAKPSRQAGSERQASGLQNHHLSLPLLPSGKSVSTTAEEEEEGGGGQRRQWGWRGRGVIRHYCLSLPTPAGQNDLASPSVALKEGGGGQRQGEWGGRGGDGDRSPSEMKAG